MPYPKKGETEKEYVNRATKIIHDENTAITAKDPQMKYKQAAAIAHSMYKKKKKKKSKKNENIQFVMKFSEFIEKNK